MNSNKRHAPVSIENLTEADKGKYVVFAGTEIGRIKSWSDRVVFVVFGADQEISTDRFTEYTGAGCNPKALQMIVQPHGYITARLRDDQLQEIRRSTEEFAQQFRDEVRAGERKRIAALIEARYESVKAASTDLMGGYDLETAGMLAGLSDAIGISTEDAQ